ncbi:flagellin N-terminal helical domain-containing protein [Desulfosporosinus nitroreducens]|uniref:flagellin N-terminal helical domain-containing protein n=1 Tax=Desulfosporosinus nitroreducens TaxID=2018668 RepID=UPI00207C98ED|nr:hypothetical protein [Desulfosporosinus nitroreducens]MCO1601322.1 hypothetical protein [Desulfosporosinus nitroreducens]
MRINNNLSALNTFHVLAINEAATVKSLRRLSSGLRINQAADDAAGLAISEKMRGQIRGLGQVARNAQDAISLIQTAEGGAVSIHAMLQRGRELAVQAANGTLTDQDREQLQDEMGQILTNIDTTANSTEFNTIKLLNQSSNGMSQFPGISQAALDQLTSKLPGWLNDGMQAINTQLGIAYPAGNRQMNVEYYYDGVATTAASMGTADGGATLTLRVNTAQVFDGSGNLLSEGIHDTLLAHELVHAFEFTEMAFSTDGLDTVNEQWFMEGLTMAIQGGNLFGVTDHNVSLTSPFDGDFRSAFEAVKELHEITDGGIDSFINRLEAGEDLDAAFANTTQDIVGTELAGALGFSNFANTTDFINWFNTAGAVLNNYRTASTDFTTGSGVITAGAVKGSSSNLTLDQTITNGTGVATVNTHFTLNFTNSAGASGSDIIFQVGANTDKE